ncbi:hypothetical protein BJ165DRAFT_1357361 [Panaeolus papilionaceus]|nr:hypothetical protein BJ165DRAFT_1357361 [Panaeolus papilionaceus]
MGDLGDLLLAPLKFEPYWKDSVQDQWVGFLGPHLDNLSSDLTLELPSWSQTHQFILSLQIKGFNSGLTPLQTTNNLALQGICKQPTCKEIAGWILHHKTLGAYGGLEISPAFQSQQNSSLPVYAAFYTIWKHLDNYLTDIDKEILGFGPMFVKHLLCKIKRYSIYWDGFMAASQLAKQQGSWTQGRNQTDNQAFPFPLVISKDDLQRLLDSMVDDLK